MGTFLNIRGGDRIALTGDSLVIGRAPECGAVIADDHKVGRKHAIMEPHRDGWSVRDLGVATGTFVNGKRIWGECRLNPGDQIRVGETVIVYESDDRLAGMTLTGVAAKAPEVTPDEQRVLDALCAPVLAGDVFSEPATEAQIGAEVSMTDAAVRRHLAALCEKFKIFDEGDRRRVRLASEAILRGAVRPAG